MSISAKVIADSRNEFGNRITTMIVTFPRIILAEFNTHRMFSRNSASSRAIPFEKMIKSVENNPFIPIAWQKDHKGMQGTEYLDSTNPYQEWLIARDKAVIQAQELSNLDVTKQVCNRLLEPFTWHTVIVTATEWENFFALRCPQYTDSVGAIFRSKNDFVNNYSGGVIEDENFIDDKFWRSINKGQAEIHMMALAEAMWDAYNESVPKELKGGEWHIPFGDNIDKDRLNAMYYDYAKELGNQSPIYSDIYINSIKVKIATARCARVSYTVVGEEDKKDNYKNDIKLHDRLLASGHMSPLEHCGQAIGHGFEYNGTELRGNGHYFGNFRGFIQYRKTFKNENIQ